MPHNAYNCVSLQATQVCKFIDHRSSPSHLTGKRSHFKESQWKKTDMGLQNSFQRSLSFNLLRWFGFIHPFPHLSLGVSIEFSSTCIISWLTWIVQGNNLGPNWPLRCDGYNFTEPCVHQRLKSVKWFYYLSSREGTVCRSSSDRLGFTGKTTDQSEGEFCDALTAAVLLTSGNGFCRSVIWGLPGRRLSIHMSQASQHKLLLSSSYILDSYSWIMISKLLNNPHLATAVELIHCIAAGNVFCNQKTLTKEKCNSTKSCSNWHTQNVASQIFTES